MAAVSSVILCAAAAAIILTCIGLAVARVAGLERPLDWAFAPTLGWATFNALSLPGFLLVGLTRPAAVIVCMAFVASAVAILAGTRAAPAGTSNVERRGPTLGQVAALLALAALVAVAPAIALLPKVAGDGVRLATEMFDHSKIAMIDDIARLGVPPGNPFFAEPRLAYYYLWHFGAAVFAVLLGVSGWEADVALTWFTAFATLALMMGLAVRHEARLLAAPLVVALSLAASLRPVLDLVLGPATMHRLLSTYPGLQNWLVQATWVPQHLASAGCVIVAVCLIARLDGPWRGPALPVLIGLLVAAGFESSTWVGGIAFALAAVPVGAVALWSAVPERRLKLAAGAVAAAGLALALASPFLIDEYRAVAARSTSAPVALWPYEVLGAWLSVPWRRVLDLPAFWLVLLVIELPAVYLAGAVALRRAVTASGLPSAERSLARALAALAIASLATTWLLASTIDNNDLGWRALLPGIMVLTAFAGAGIARWAATGRRLAVAAMAALILLGGVDSLKFLRESMTGLPSRSAASFARSPELWAAVRRQAGTRDRIANNPLFAADMLIWPVNISWALLSDRRSCFASRELARAYVALPAAEIDRINALFVRVFAGDAQQGDVAGLAGRFDCRVVVVTPDDGAWQRDPFAGSPAYRLADGKPDRWRIYVATAAASAAPAGSDPGRADAGDRRQDAPAGTQGAAQ